MRVLGLDLGRRRIGVAVSDPGGVIALPIEAIQHKTLNRTVERIHELVDEYEVERIVIGLPVQMSGEEGIEAGRAREFGAKLEAALGVPVFFWDERLSTAAAERVLIETGATRERRRRQIDAAAAAIILQSYLDHTARSQSSFK